MSLNKSLILLMLFLNGLPLFAQESSTELKRVIAVQQATITTLNKNLEDAATAAANARKVADEALSKANAAATAAANAQTSANAAATSAGRFFTSSTGGGGRSCQTQCGSQGASCVVAYAGNWPFETWTCNADPAGNLLCLCART
ncbi:hypothetical protein [Oligoflexus tunisiensis]|uniref:hypothetical protein n=1 Tax=Oligoflexus tunisiensis TaxID=708132 RepID=UPI00114D25E1|nr:hypothetical protein [Oligoflexus tunisiensis]